MSDTSIHDGRLTRARAAVEEATRSARLARIAAAEELRDRARRRSTLLKRALVAGLVVATLLVICAAALAVADRRADERVRLDAAVIAAADRASIAMLTSDPGDGAGYVTKVAALSIGEQRQRILEARDSLRAAIAEQPAGTGTVVASGLITDPPANTDGARATVLLVVAATNPELVGGDPETQRVTLRLTMLRSEGAWLVEQAQTE